jgi:succinylarginine dihydrolase
VFIYGADGSADDAPSARQDLSASRAIADAHHARHTLFVKQNADIIKSGVFHNDVIAVGNENVLLVHERAFSGKNDIARIAEAYQNACADTLHVLTVRESEITIEEAVSTYLFNSQIVTKPNGKMTIIAPQEVSELYDGKALHVLQKMRDDASNPIDEIIMLDLRQSMRNGGGPACLRLRAGLTQTQVSALEASVNVLANDALFESLEALIEKYYPDTLTATELSNPALYYNGKTLHDEMLALMRLAC